MPRQLSAKVLEGLGPRQQVEVALVAARLALSFWRRAFPEKERQEPLVAALQMVEAFCVSGSLPPDAKVIAELAYIAVSACDLLPGDIHRSSGFSVAHVAMTPWLLSAGSESKAKHNAMVAVNYAEAIHAWAGSVPELEATLLARASELAGA
jgi:hypothetical protein